MSAFSDSAFTFSNFLVELPVKKPRHTHSKWQDSCTVCHCDFSVGGDGVHEVKRHCSMQ